MAKLHIKLKGLRSLIEYYGSGRPDDDIATSDASDARRSHDEEYRRLYHNMVTAYNAAQSPEAPWNADDDYEMAYRHAKKYAAHAGPEILKQNPMDMYPNPIDR